MVAAMIILSIGLGIALLAWMVTVEARIARIQGEAEATLETTSDLYAEIESTDEWLGLEPGAPVNSLSDELRDAVAPLERRLAALEPVTPLEPWEVWLRDTKMRQYNRAAQECGCFECVAFGHGGPCTNPKPDDFRFAEVDDFGSESAS